jgi:hypothetical protein
MLRLLFLSSVNVSLDTDSYDDKKKQPILFVVLSENVVYVYFNLYQLKINIKINIYIYMGKNPILLHLQKQHKKNFKKK